MAEMSIDVSVYCDQSGHGELSVLVAGTDIHVEPCEQCLLDAKKEGLDEGYFEGYADAGAE